MYTQRVEHSAMERSGTLLTEPLWTLLQNCTTSAEAIAKALDIPVDQVLLESTGVIGRQLKMEALLQGVPQLAGSLGASADAAQHAAVAITTTDLVSKSAALEASLQVAMSHPVQCLAGRQQVTWILHAAFCADTDETNA